MSFIEKIYSDPTLCGHCLTQLPAKSWAFAKSEANTLYHKSNFSPPQRFCLVFEKYQYTDGTPDKVTTGTNLIFMEYLELAFRRVGGFVFTACALITALPLGMAIKTIHAVKCYLMPQNESGLNIRTVLNEKTSAIINAIGDQTKDNPISKITSALFVITVNCDGKEVFSDKKPIMYHNKALEDVDHESIISGLLNNFWEQACTDLGILHAKEISIQWEALIKHLAPTGEKIHAEVHGLIKEPATQD
jgi:hypothetical protein